MNKLLLSLICLGLIVLTAPAQLTGRKIGVDPGHGGGDPGAIGPTGYQEKEAALMTSLALKRYLEADGATVFMTRRTDPTGGAQIELATRSAYFVSNAVDRALSVHYNSAGATARRVMDFVYCGKCAATASNLAQPIIFRVANVTGQPFGNASSVLCTGLTTNDCLGLLGTGQANLHMVRVPELNGNVPSVLVETAFISNPGDETYYRSQDNMDGAGWGIYAGVTDHYGVTPKPRQPTPIEADEFFVRQQYIDFLSREPDLAGWDYWTDQMRQCGADAACISARRIGVSAAFYIELEFQDTGYFVYRFYQASFNRRPNYAEFTPDRAQVVGGADIEQGKTNFTNAWVTRPAFLQAFPLSLSPAEFVDGLNTNTGNSLTPAERDALIADLTNGTKTRAQALRVIIDNQAFRAREYNKAFVQMQYFGYLKRDPDQGGYDFWLGILNQQPNNFRGMVCAFITATEYQRRFGTATPRTNAECP
jgi:N-acetylmuramoyl-L-alanine amidase